MITGTNITLEKVLALDKILEDEIKQFEETIENSKRSIKELKTRIDENHRNLLLAFGLKQGDKVKYVHHEWFGPLSAYSAPFEQTVYVDRMFTYRDKPYGEIGVILKKSPKHKRGTNIYWSSYSLYKMTGELILENILQHTRPVEEFSEEKKSRIAEGQKI